MSLRIVAIIAVLVATRCDYARTEDWYQFRGPNGNGHSAEVGLPTVWDSFFERPRWKATLPGQGWSSPIVVGNRIWLTASELVAFTKEEAEEKIANLPYDIKDFKTHASVSLFAIEIDADTGAILRRISLFECAAPPPIHSWNSYASPTPVTDGKCVFCHFGSLGTACIEIESGSVLWRREFKVEEITGGASSPVLWRDFLCLACDGADEQYVVAVDKRTGKTVWRADRPTLDGVDPLFRRAFSTPIVIDSNGRVQLISMSAQWLVSLNPYDGQEWWRAKVGNGYSTIPRPLFHGDNVFVCTGYGKPEMVAVNIHGHGDVTNSHIVWRSKSQVPEISSPILVGDQIYFVSLSGVATSVDVATGQKIWQTRLGGSYAASPTVADGHLYFTSREGVTTVIRPSRELEVVAKNELFGESYASLAVYRNHFLLRTAPVLFCLEKR